jgi:hypothetical protein
MRSHFGWKQGPTEATPLNHHGAALEIDNDDQEENNDVRLDRQGRAADQLSMRLLQVHTEDEERVILKETLGLESSSHHHPKPNEATKERFTFGTLSSLLNLLGMALLVLSGLTFLLFLGTQFVGPPNQPIGPYRLLERQVGMFHCNLIYT